MSNSAQTFFNFSATLKTTSFDSMAQGPAKIVNLSLPISKLLSIMVFIEFII